MTYRSRTLSPIIAAVLVLSGVAGSLAETESKPAQKAAANPDDSANSWYAQAISQGRAGLNVTNFWSRGSQLRSETIVGGHKIVTIVSGDTYYAFDVLAMNGVAIERAKSAVESDDPGRRPFGNEVETLISQGAEKVREEVVMGTMCNVYQITDDSGRRVLWASHGEWELPVRIEIYNRQTGERKNTNFMDWSNGIPIKETFFVPNANVVFEKFTLSEYIEHSQSIGPVGSVPVLYADLLHGRRRK